MKFLVLALCVCAASAASFGQTPFGSGGYKNFKPNTVASAAVAPAVFAGKATAAAAAAVVEPVAATYQAAKNVVTGYANDESKAVIIRSDSEVNDNGYNYVYETGNGIYSQATGALKQVGDAAVVISEGAYRYVAPDGTPVEISYTADENGYHPQGDVLPVGPEIPEAIARSLVYIASHPSEAAQKY